MLAMSACRRQLAQFAHRRRELRRDLVPEHVATVDDDLEAAAPDAIHQPIPDREDPRVEDLIVVLAGERRMVGAKGQNVG